MTSSAQGIDDRETANGISPSDHFAIFATIVPTVFRAGPQRGLASSAGGIGTRFWYADANGDKCLDRHAWNPDRLDGAGTYERSRCDGTFDPKVTVTRAGSVSARTDYFYGDLDGDGCADKVYWNPTFDGGRLRVYRSTCDGQYGAVLPSGSPASEGTTTRWWVARIDADACADVVGWNRSVDGGRLRFYRSRCDGTFDGPRAITEGASTSATVQHFFADLNGDGSDDLFRWDPEAEDGLTRMWRSDRDGTFTSLGTHSAGSSVVATSRFYFADVTGDGQADKIFWRPNFREGRLQVYPGTGAGFAGVPTMDNTGYSQSEATEFSFADVDGDGAADKVYWNPGGEGGLPRVYRARR